MSRREHERVSPGAHVEGLLQVPHQIVLRDGNAAADLVVVSRTHAVAGDVISVQVPGEEGNDEAHREVKMRVARSRPVVIRSSVWYELQLVPVAPDAAAESDEDGQRR